MNTKTNPTLEALTNKYIEEHNSISKDSYYKEQNRKRKEASYEMPRRHTKEEFEQLIQEMRIIGENERRQEALDEQVKLAAKSESKKQKFIATENTLF